MAKESALESEPESAEELASDQQELELELVPESVLASEDMMGMDIMDGDGDINTDITINTVIMMDSEVSTVVSEDLEV